MKIYLISCLLLFIFSNNSKSIKQEYEKSCIYVDTFDYKNTVPYSEEVDDEYFKDAIIVGDSRVGSLLLYNKLKDADIYSIQSLSLNKFNITKYSDDIPKTLYEIVMDSDKNNIYIMLGLNEIGMKKFDKWANNYDRIIKEIKEKHPLANIYLIEVYTPTHTYGVKKDDIVNKVKDINSYIKKVAEDNYVYHINADEILLGDNNVINKDYAFDGIHFNSLGTEKFVEFLKTHIAGEKYVKKICD